MFEQLRPVHNVLVMKGRIVVYFTLLQAPRDFAVFGAQGSCVQQISRNMLVGGKGGGFFFLTIFFYGSRLLPQLHQKG